MRGQSGGIGRCSSRSVDTRWTTSWSADASATSSGVTGALRLYAAWKTRGSQTISVGDDDGSEPSRTRSSWLPESDRAKRVIAGATR